jgi:2Fe-2S ferredoxin
LYKIHYIAPDGTARTAEAADGATLRDTALAAGIDGIVGSCGGNMMCGTCHVYVADDWLDRVGLPDEDQEAVLESLGLRAEVRASSRLSCQIRMSAELDGLTVHLPKSQPGI